MIGQQIENYKIISMLGEGAMGVVYKAMDVNLERVVALKLMNAGLSHHPELEARFRAEARTQATLNHHNIATLYSFLIWQGKAVMVMEYVDGKTLQQMITACGALPPSTALALCKQALYGVGAAHKHGIIHRDLKPANLMMSNEGVIKVMDFGIAKIKGGAGLKGTSMAIGTYDYMAPEQALNKPVDARTDIYSMGITLYEMLTGEVPFKFDSEFAVQLAHQQQRPVNPRKHNPEIPQVVADIVMRALEKNPDDRFASTEEFIRAMPKLSVPPAQPVAQTRTERGTVIDTGGFIPSTAPPPIANQGSHPSGINYQQPRSDYSNSGAVESRPQNAAKPPKKKTGILIGAAAGVLIAIGLATAWLLSEPKATETASAKPDTTSTAPVNPVTAPVNKPTPVVAPQPVPKGDSRPITPPDTKPPIDPNKGEEITPPNHDPIVTPPTPISTPDEGLVGSWTGSYMDSTTQESTGVELKFQGPEDHLTGTAKFISDGQSGECSVSGSSYDPAKRKLTLSYTSCKGTKAPPFLHLPTTFDDVDSSAKRLTKGHVYTMTTINAAFVKHGS